MFSDEGILFDRLAIICKPIVNCVHSFSEWLHKNQGKHIEGISLDIGPSPIQMEKGGNTFIATVVHGQESVLQESWQGVNSAVKLEIPHGIYAIVVGCVYTNPAPFLSLIPNSECFIAPTVGYSVWPTKYSHQKTLGLSLFKLTVPHAAKNPHHRNSIVVRKGDIAVAKSEENFKAISKLQGAAATGNSGAIDASQYYVLDNEVLIYTRTFSQFTCTTCEKTCDAGAMALIYGGMAEGDKDMIVKTRIFLGSPLYDIIDYKLVRYYM